MFRVVLFSLLAHCLLLGPSNAALITPATSATFQVDTSGVSAPFTITGGAWNCYVTCSAVGNGTAQFADDASARFNFGTSISGSDLGSLVATNPFDLDISDFSGAIFGANQLTITSPLNTLYVTVVFIDDSFAIDWLQIFVGSSTFLQATPAIPPSEIPLPSALPLFLLGGIAISQVSLRRKR